MADKKEKVPFEDTDKKPAYGMLQFSRVSGGDPNLFGSSVKHNEKIRLSLKEGHVSRELNSDWYFSDKTLFEVEMSYTQFAELISSMNVGSGVPVTIRYTAESGSVPGFETSNKRAQFIDEFAEKNSESAETAEQIIEKISSIFKEKRSIKVAEKEEILADLRRLYNAITNHNTFMLEQFDESMEKISTEAKGEVEAFVENKMRSIAVAALAEKELASISEEAPVLLEVPKEK